MKNNIKKWTCRIIFGIIFFVIIAGLFVECGQKSLKVGDVIFDRPED